MSCVNSACSDCDGNYPEIASAFTRVPNNFNSVNNSIDKFTIYKTLSVVEKAVEHAACCDRKCAETGKDDPFAYPSRSDNIYDLGFLHFPLRIRTDFAQVCGDVKCVQDGPLVSCECCGNGDIDCSDSVLGYVGWPVHETAQDIRACNAIKGNVACLTSGRGPEAPRECEVLLDCEASSAAAAASVSKRRHRKRRGCGCH